jgi:c-di-GMP-binding flagellar brake protein YcgR
MENYEEKRKYRRALFTIEDDIIGVFSLASKPGKTLIANIFNLSMGGIYFTLNAAKRLIPAAGDRIVLLQIKVQNSQNFILNIDAEVKWVLNPPILKDIGIGCEFIQIPQTSRKQLEDFVEIWYEK